MIVLIQLSDKYKLVLYCIKILIIAILQSYICWLYGRDENIDGHSHSVDPVVNGDFSLSSMVHFSCMHKLQWVVNFFWNTVNQLLLAFEKFYSQTWLFLETLFSMKWSVH